MICTQALLHCGGITATACQPYAEPVARHDLGRMDRVCPKCGALHWLGEHSQKSGSATLYPLFGMCCSDGNIELPSPPSPPNALQRLFSGSTPKARQFRENIRQYNAALSFTSLRAQIDNSVNRGSGGPLVFKIYGELSSNRVSSPSRRTTACLCAAVYH